MIAVGTRGTDPSTDQEACHDHHPKSRSSDDDMTTTPAGDAGLGGGDADGTDGDATDTTDGDASDGGDADGTDGDSTDTTDGDAS